MRHTLLTTIVADPRPSLIYLFGPCHTSTSPDEALWMSSNYCVNLNHIGPVKTLPSLRKKKSGPDDTYKIQVKITGQRCCTWEDIASCRGKICKNGEKAAGADLLLIDSTSNLIVGVDCKSKHRSVFEIARQFIQCLASHPPVGVLFSIRCRKTSSDMYQIAEELDGSIYEQVYLGLKDKFPERYEDENYDSLMYRMCEEVGMKPQHVLMGVEFLALSHLRSLEKTIVCTRIIVFCRH
ncbi:hypothetical protein GEMRC1_007570 [Eukaryota sp. GEM-RC1]